VRRRAGRVWHAPVCHRSREGRGTTANACRSRLTHGSQFVLPVRLRLALSRSFMALAPRGQPPSPSSDERLPLSTVSLSLRSENVAVVGDEELRRSGGGGDGDDGLRRGCDDGSTASMLGRLPASDAAIGAGFASVLARLMLASKVSEALALLSRLLQLKDAPIPATPPNWSKFNCFFGPYD